LREELTRLILQRDRLRYDALVSRQDFFAAVRAAHPRLDTHRGLRYREHAGKLYIEWDDRGPQFALGDDAELAQLHPFVRRRRGRRNWDVIF
jgi:hypothetical protein